MVKNGILFTVDSKMDMVVTTLGGDHIKDTSSKLDLLSESKEEFNLFGEHEIPPRLGEEYQVSLPELVSRSKYDEQLRGEVKDEETYDFLGGLPLSVMWIQPGPNNNKPEAADSEEKARSVINENGSNRSGSFPVPDSSYKPLDMTEEEIFLLGLYIFERDFVLVKNFVGSRNIGEILLHYYGKFYGSQRYKRWLKSKKARGGRCACGKKMFTGLRQQELLSRLLPTLSEEGKNELLEVSKTFTEGKVLLEEYVMTLKNIVGLNNLVEAVGIGQGKHDLTRMALQKSNQATHLHPRWPTRKVFATYSPEDILNFLQGGGRLSKAHSHDLFWEAVWPRLLAKGWHSEQSPHSIFSKEYFVFLVPGVKKFSRRKLVKGQDYFDSVCDVLNKVVSDPRILDLNGESGEGYRVEEMTLDQEMSHNRGEGYRVEEMNLDQEKSPNRDRYSHPNSRTQSCGEREDVMFTVIDTSITVADGETRKLRELRGLPVEVNPALLGSHLMGDDRNSIEVEKNAQDPSGESNYLSFNMVEADIFNPVQIISFDKKETPANNKAVNDSLNRAVQSNSTKCKRKTRKKPDEKNLIAPEPRKRRKMKFSPDKQMGSCSSVGKQMKPEMEKEEIDSCPANNFLVNENSAIVGENETEHKPRPMMLIDLNMPVMPDPETSEPGSVEMPMEQHNQLSQHDGVPVSADASSYPANPELQPSTNSRRQSGRNRLMSTRALEALASGLMAREIRRRR